MTLLQRELKERYVGYNRLPNAYQEVEYIESDGNAYVNTGILSKNINEIEMDISDIYQGSSYADQYSYIVFGTTASSWWFSSTYYTYNGARFRYHKALTGGPHDDCNAPQTGSVNHLIYTRTQFTVNGNVGTQAGTDPSWTNADEYPVCFWYCGNNSRSKYKMYSLKITANDGEHNYIPCYRKSDDVIGLYSLEDEEFYTNAGTGNFTKGNDVLLKAITEVYVGKELRLPVEYQEVEYIQSSGTQYINTGYTPLTTTEFDITYERVSFPSQYQTPMGTRKDYNTQAYYFGWDNTNSRSFYGFGTNHVDPSTVVFGGLGQVFNITYKNGVISNGTQSANVAVSNSPYGNLCIFADEHNGNVQEFCAMKLYGLKLWEGGTLIRNFVPCYRKSDNIIGLYDTVNSQFYTNSGSGTFTKGNDILPYTKIRPVGGTQQIVIQAALSTGTNVYPLGLTVKPKKITVTFSSYHNSGRSDQGIYIGLNSDYCRGFYWGDGSNYSYDTCWLRFYTGSENRILQDKYASIGTRPTILTLELDKSSVQQGEAAEKSGTLSSAQQDIVNNLFNDYTNLKLLCAGTRSYLTSDVVIDIEY